MAETDAQLVQRTLAGDRMAFGELYDRYARVVRSICFHETGNLGEAQDLTQDVFMRAYGKLKKLRQQERFGPWLVSIARNVCREYRRGRARDRHVLVGLETPEILPDKDQDPQGRIEQMALAMKHLSEQERMALSTYYLQDQDAQKAVALMEVSRSTFYRLLASAKEKIETYIKHREEK
ncbi:MAG: RNA polymerase sigma factor [Sedimentisphaerales bacterium]|nr:RNA polymerase sigma factor [Sedimentisphaerales bacterium]